jgi:glycosyltransferase involved in cell wall biosynthesis
MCLLEAFSVGTPVLVPNHGSFTAIVSDKQEGLHFSTSDVSSLTSALHAALSMEKCEWTGFSIAARGKFLREYAGSTNYHRLMAIYAEAIDCQRQLSSREKVQPRKVTGPAGVL